MANPKLIKTRVSSIKNIRKITRALEMVSASKVQKAQSKAINSRPFADKIYELVQNLGGKVDTTAIPLLRTPESRKNALFVLISTNKGLAGSLNTNLFRFLNGFLQKNNYAKKSFVTLGKKGRNFALTQGELLADFSDIQPFESAVGPIIKIITDSFIKEETDEIYLVYSDFITALTYEPRARRILPLEIESAPTKEPELTGKESEAKEFQKLPFSFEPSADAVLIKLLPFYLETLLTEVIYEAEASEHSARMVAMKNASENANQLAENLQHEYNSARQQTITTEINDIVTAKVSLE
jgi:F-type H+-transporting ATPase subunit gamma